MSRQWQRSNPDHIRKLTAHHWLLRHLGHVNDGARLLHELPACSLSDSKNGKIAGLHARLQACQYSPCWPASACACAYSTIYAWKLWAETLLSPQSGKVPRHLEAELPLAGPILSLGQIAGWCWAYVASLSPWPVLYNASSQHRAIPCRYQAAGTVVTTRTR